MFKINNIKPIQQIYHFVYFVSWTFFYIELFKLVKWDELSNFNYKKAIIHDYLNLWKQDEQNKISKYIFVFNFIQLMSRLLIPNITPYFYENLIHDIFNNSLLYFSNKNILSIFLIYLTFNWTYYLSILGHYGFNFNKIIFKNYFIIKDIKLLIVLILISKTVLLQIYLDISNQIYNIPMLTSVLLGWYYFTWYLNIVYFTPIINKIKNN